MVRGESPPDTVRGMAASSRFDEVISAPEVLGAIDTELSALLPALELSWDGWVVALALARMAGFVSLLPFHLHVRWPDALH